MRYAAASIIFAVVPARALAISTAILCFAVLAPAAAAQEPPAGDNIVGIYTGDFTGPTASHFEGIGTAEVYVVVSGVWCGAEVGIYGWELKVRTEGTGAALAGATLLGGGPINISTPPEFQVGLGQPIQAASPHDTYALARLSFVVNSADPTFLYLEPIRIPSRIGEMAFATDQRCEIMPLYAASGATDLPVFGFNTGPLGLPHERPSVVGIYTNDFDGPTAAHFEGSGTVTLYVVLSEISCGSEVGLPELCGWWLRVDQEGSGAALVGTEIFGAGATNSFVPPNFCVHFEAPPAPGPLGTLTVASLTYQVAWSDPAYLYIRWSRCGFDYDIEGPGYSCGCWVDDVPVKLHPSSGSEDAPVFGFNSGPVLEVEDRTWGGIKGIYR